MTKITILDTTLRDGMQGTGINFTLKDKIAVARRLDDLGVDYIEGGFPLANEKEKAFFEEFKNNPLKKAKLTAFGSTRRPGKRASDDPHTQALVDAGTPTVVVVGKSWMAHVEKVLGTNAEENLAMIRDSITYLVGQGKEVLFDLEHFFDGYKAHPEYSMEVLKAGTECGASHLVLCDTNGGTLCSEVEKILKELKTHNLAPLGVHTHNDMGLGVANSVVGIENGAVHVQGTINGWGERAGNANLCAIMPTLHFKLPFSFQAGENLTHLTELSRWIAEKANIIPDKRQPWVGSASFSHKAGQHVDVLAKAQDIMEHIDPAVVGNTRKILLSELAGKSTVVHKLKKYGEFNKQSPEVIELTRILKEKESLGYEYEAAEASFELLILKALGRYTQAFELDNYHLEIFKTGDEDAKTVGRIFASAKGKKWMGAGKGTGPVGVLDQAFRDAFTKVYPFLEKIHLTDYSVRVLDAAESAAEGKVRVFITCSDHQQSWDTVGVSENIVEASWEALVDSMEYYANVVLP
jgi:2-isopropylmalate synthase